MLIIVAYISVTFNSVSCVIGHIIFKILTYRKAIYKGCYTHITKVDMLVLLALNMILGPPVFPCNLEHG